MIFIYTYNQIINEQLHVLFRLEVSRMLRLIVLTISFVFIGIPSFFCKKDKVNNVIQITNIALIVLCVVCICIYNLINNNVHNNHIKELAFLTRNQNISTSLSMIILSISIHPFLYKQMNELQLFTMKRAKKMLVSTSLIQFVFYLLFGLLAFLTTQYNNINDATHFPVFFICNPNLTSLRSVVLYYIIQLFKFLIALICVYNSSITLYELYVTIKTHSSLQINNTSLNNSYELVKYQNEQSNNVNNPISKNNNTLFKFFCVVILIVINVIILFKDDSIHLAFTFSGGFCAGIICYVFPCVGYLLVFKYEKHLFKCFVVVVMCILGLIGIGITIDQCVVLVNEML